MTKAVALRTIPEHSRLEKTIQTCLMNLKEFCFKVPEKITWRTADMGQNVLGRCQMTIDGSKIMILITKDWESLSHMVLQSVVYHELLHSMHPGEHHGGGWARDAKKLSNLVGIQISARIPLNILVEDVDMIWDDVIEEPDSDNYFNKSDAEEGSSNLLDDGSNDRSELQQELNNLGLEGLSDCLL